MLPTRMCSPPRCAHKLFACEAACRQLQQSQACCRPCIQRCLPVVLPLRRAASVEAVTPLVCLTVDRATFTAVLGPLQQLMSREKSPAVVTQRLMKLQARGGPSRVPAEVLVRRRRRSRSKGTDVWEVIRARGHLDEVLELRSGSSAAPPGSGSNSGGGSSKPDAGGAMAQLVLTEGSVLGGGAFSRVSVVSEQTSGRSYALKRMRKSAVVQCPEHVFCEQTITRNLTHPFCIRQYASFQVRAGQRRATPDVLGSQGVRCVLPVALSVLAPAVPATPVPLPRAFDACRARADGLPSMCSIGLPLPALARPCPAQDRYHLYFLFDLMSGGDLMDVLVSEAQVIKVRVAQGALKRGCFAPQVRPPAAGETGGRRDACPCCALACGALCQPPHHGAISC